MIFKDQKWRQSASSIIRVGVAEYSTFTKFQVVTVFIKKFFQILIGTCHPDALSGRCTVLSGQYHAHQMHSQATMG